MSDHGQGGHRPNSVPPQWAKWILRIFFAACALLVVIDFLYHRHVEHPWEGVPAFYALFGFIGLAVLITLSKVLRRLVMRSEDYYDAG